MFVKNKNIKSNSAPKTPRMNLIHLSPSAPVILTNLPLIQSTDFGAPIL